VNKLSITEVELKGKRVFIRADFNVPLDRQGNITDDTRIRAVLPTINYTLDEGAERIILASHLGRPKGKRIPGLSLAPVARRLQRLLNKEVKFIPDCVGDEANKALSKLNPGDVALLENLRFHPQERANDEEFGRQLASHADIYVNDAFATAHRCHASNVAITRYLPHSVAGFLMRKEIQYFEEAMGNPIRPFVAILGGAKVSDKIGILKNLLKRVDKVILGGGMTFTFLKAMGREVGKSLVEDEMLGAAEDIMQAATKKGVRLYLPVDCVVADKFDPRAETKIVTIQEIPREWRALDIGPATTTLFSEALQNAKTIIWNGPMGVFEMDAFSRGTMAMVNMLANSYALTIVGGGDTDVAVHRAGESYRISYISTGGGAFLQLLEGNQLPGMMALTDKIDD
jgi:phosphoglycerate kinase